MPRRRFLASRKAGRAAGERIVAQRLRLVSGLVLFTYVTTHLLNHALGLISLQAAEAGRFWFLAFWRSPVGTLLLYPSLVCHVTLVLWKVYQRRTLRMPPAEIFRLILGLLIPLQLIAHIFGTRVILAAFGVDYTYTSWMLTYGAPVQRALYQQVALLLVAWTHGCIGLYYWLRVKPGHTIAVSILGVLAIVIPLLALGGVLSMLKEVNALAADPAWVQQTRPMPRPEDVARLNAWRDTLLTLFVVSVGLVFIGRRIRTIWERGRKGVLRLTYPSGRQVLITPGTTVLEASRSAGIPHASLCGGRGRCSTCRVRIGDGVERLPNPSADEARVLRRVGAPPNVRLACQLRPTADLDVFPLLPPSLSQPVSFVGQSQIQGREQEIAILFADLRSFTRFSEHRLPYDVLFVLNQYFAAMGTAVEEAGGYLDKFIGDGVMALFGLDGDPSEGCHQALRGAVAMARALDNLNRVLDHDLPEPLRMGIGIHVGPVIVGEMGHRRARSLTAIGDPVNTASRLEALTKEYASQLVVSDDVTRLAGIDLSSFPSHEIEVRGRTTTLSIRVIANIYDLEPALAASSPVSA
jgi:adenylate cyclase